MSYLGNGEPKSKYKSEVREKILKKKEEHLAEKERMAQAMMKFAGMSLKGR